MAARVSTPSLLAIRMLGPFRVAVDGKLIEERRWSRRKPALLVKLLALQPHHQLHREQVMEMLRPDSDPGAASNNLHKVIHQARRALEPALKSAADSHFVLTQGQQVMLRAPIELWMDVEEFEQRAASALGGRRVEAYEEALALYQGDLLLEDPSEDWAAARREQLRALRQQLLLKLAAFYEGRGEYRRAIERLEELVAGDATNEEAHRRLMRLYALTGNKRQAMRQYQLCCEALLRELDAEPERATGELCQQIASGRFSALLPASEVERERGSSQAIRSLAVLPLSNSSADYYARRYDRAIEQCQKVLEMDPHFYWAYFNLARAYEQKGMFDQAIAELRKAVEMSQGNTHVLAALGRACAVAGRRKEAQSLLGELIDKAERGGASPYDIAIIYAGLEEKDQAFQRNCPCPLSCLPAVAGPQRRAGTSPTPTVADLPKLSGRIQTKEADDANRRRLAGVARICPLLGEALAGHADNVCTPDAGAHRRGRHRSRPESA